MLPSSSELTPEVTVFRAHFFLPPENSFAFT